MIVFGMNDILFIKTVDSTNRIARELAVSGKPHGFGVLAEKQTAGRGRLGRVWQSVPGKGLCCTILLRPELAIHDYAKIPLTAGLAVSLVLEELCGIDVQLKWPNDIYLFGRKCGGVLVETSSLLASSDQCFVLVGIGLNVNGDHESFSVELQKIATSLFIETGREYDILSIFVAVRSRLLQLLSQCHGDGFKAILEAWQERDMLQGRWMNWVTPSGEVVNGRSLGIDSSGVLLIEDYLGTRHKVLSGDLSMGERSPDQGSKTENDY